MSWNPTCYDCLLAEIDPGDPGCHTLPNGDPGRPEIPASIIGCPRCSEDHEGIDPLDCEMFRPRRVEPRCIDWHKVDAWKGQIRRWKERTGQIETFDVWYCPGCEIELFPFREDGWWISDRGVLYMRCAHCEQEVLPRAKRTTLCHKIPYREAIRPR